MNSVVYIYLYCIVLQCVELPSYFYMNSSYFHRSKFGFVGCSFLIHVHCTCNSTFRFVLLFLRFLIFPLVRNMHHQSFRQASWSRQLVIFRSNSQTFQQRKAIILITSPILINLSTLWQIDTCNHFQAVIFLSFIQQYRCKNVVNGCLKVFLYLYQVQVCEVRT